MSSDWVSGRPGDLSISIALHLSQILLDLGGLRYLSQVVLHLCSLLLLEFDESLMGTLPVGLHVSILANKFTGQLLLPLLVVDNRRWYLGRCAELSMIGTRLGARSTHGCRRLR
mmetsp:Transcript_238/g.271  ORF Transcript_238/g.271 Transcript_238/m.271 type:complete len:114 (-) Transcript_238:738-1079(-)